MPLPKKILYAEDDPVTATVFRWRLERAGFEVMMAPDGLEALKLLQTYQPDLLLLDLMLPKFSGEEVLKFVAAHPALGQIPVIVLSTNSILTAANEPLLDQAEKRLLKHDCNFSTLLAAIEQALSAEHVAARAAARQARQDRQNAAAQDAEREQMLGEIKSLHEQAQVVCAWTDRIQISGKWLKLTEFLSDHLHLKVTHGVSPEGREQFLKEKQN